MQFPPRPGDVVGILKEAKAGQPPQRLPEADSAADADAESEREEGGERENACDVHMNEQWAGWLWSDFEVLTIKIDGA
jgi:hypothetical protein